MIMKIKGANHALRPGSAREIIARGSTWSKLAPIDFAEH
jgi:hypothetical protein